MAEERQAALEERGDGDLVGGVVGTGAGAAGLAGLPGEREQREGLQVGRLELERQAARRGRAAGTGVAARSG